MLKRAQGLSRVVQEGRFLPAIRWQLSKHANMLRERWYRLRLALPQHMPAVLPAMASTGRGIASAEATRMAQSLEAAIRGESRLVPEIRAIAGMSGQLYRSFINNYLRDRPGLRYLEVGSWGGSTATAAMYGNDVEVICIDNWSQFGGPRDTFFANVALARSEKVRFGFIESDFRAVDYRALGTFDVYLFDGPHKEHDQYDGVMLAQPALAARHLLIVDDWNWRAVRNGTLRALIDLGCRIEAASEIRTSLDGTLPAVNREQSDWHNGYFLAVINKKTP
ncbi:MAG: class I SAM-dependent methyltransferase [Enhydrobacter sp.]|nr:MAG: class I SAM-dependent methyltransferase [Enhydrobacter sp.]